MKERTGIPDETKMNKDREQVTLAAFGLAVDQVVWSGGAMEILNTLEYCFFLLTSASYLWIYFISDYNS